jgi:quinol monooxygenase YgiN
LRANQSFQSSPRFPPIHLIPRYQRMIQASCLCPVVGLPLANTICMILVTIRMKVLAEKRKELCQTIALLIGSLRTEKGCGRCNFYRSMEDENELCILEEWDTRKNLNSHLKSELFRVLRGAMSLLQEPHEKEVWDGRD